MGGPDQSARSAVVESVAPPEPALVKALQVLYRAYQKLSIYPREHPSIPEALSEAETAFKVALEDRPSIALIVGRDYLTVDGQSLAESTGAAEALALLLHDADVATLEVRAGVTAGELRGLILILADARQGSVRGQDLIELLQAEELPNLEATPIDYGALEFSEGVRDPGEELNVWEKFSSLLLDPGSAKEEMSPEEMAEQVILEIERHEGAGIGLLQKRLQRVNQRVGRLSARERAAVRDRMAKFVVALNPRLRRDLLRLDFSARGDEEPAMTDLLDVVPEPDLLEALQEIDHSGGRMSRQMTTLMNKLMRVSETRPTLAAGLKDVLAKWGMSQDALGNRQDDNVKSAMAEVLQRRGDDNSNPVPYQNLLDDLARIQLPQTGSPSDTRYRDPEDGDESRLQACQIALQALAAPGGEEQRAGILTYLAAATDELLARGHFDTVRDAAVVAKTYAVMKNAPEETSTAARKFLESFAIPERVRLILRNSREGKALPGAAISLLALGGNTAIQIVVEHLLLSPKGAAADALRKFLSDRGGELVGWIAHKLRGGWESVQPILGFLAVIGPRDSIPLLESMLRNDDPRIRREAFRLLCERDRRAGAAERYIRRALKDSDRSVIGYALQRLTVLRSVEAAEILGDIVEGSPRNLTDVADYRLRAADLLADRGAEGVRLICHSLETLRKCLRPIDARVATTLARLLEEHQKEEKVAECLRRWRFSSAHVVSLLLGRGIRKAVAKA
jgi:hypothetical protein